jgi:hypothetical protein
VTAWISKSTVAGMPSSKPIQVSPGELRTAITTSPRMAIPNTLNSERPTSLFSMNGYSSTAASCAASRTAEGSRRANLSTRRT